MCGIAGGIFTIRPDRRTLERAREEISHRGPDDSGIEILGAAPPFVGLVSTRLSIIDISERGHQPMADPERRYWIVFNGEIYNYKSLRAELAKQGYPFGSNSDTEVILAAYSKWKETCVDRLEGMFSFAIWDSREKRLFAARDRFGKKPFLYAHDADGSFRFASEMRSLLSLSASAREVDPEALSLYLVYQYIPPPWTIFKGMLKLPPASSLLWEKGKLSVRRYWSPEPLEGLSSRRPEELTSQLRTLLADSVRARLIADVPVGVFLSGGIDSSLVVALASKVSTRKIQTFSIGFPDKSHDESRFAKLVSDHYGTEHHAFQVRPDAVDLLPKLVDHYGEPFADSSAIPTYYLARETSRSIKVVLTGDGGDELFMGYPRYKAVQFAHRIPQVANRLLASPWLAALLQSGKDTPLRKKAYRFVRFLNRDPRSRYLGWIGVFHPEELPSLLGAGLSGKTGDPAQFLDDLYDSAPPFPDFLAETAYVDLVSYLPHDLLVKVDIATMAHGLEARCPFLDPQLARFALGLSTWRKITGKAGKWVLKAAFKELLPKPIRTRRKMGFSVPLTAWFRGELRDLLCDTLSPARVRGRGWFNPETVQTLIDEHLQERRAHPNRLWALLFLETWAERFLPGSG